MINQKSIDAVDTATYGARFRKPLYDSYCFANIPGTIEHVLTGKTERPTLPHDVLGNLGTDYDQVVLMFVDAFGWRFFERYQDKYPFLKRIVDQGVASKLTSQFPSTTSAHVTTIQSGQSLSEHGVFEWYYYEPTFERMISPLKCAFARDMRPGALVEAGIDHTMLYPRETFYQDLKRRGVTSYVYQSNEFTPSPYNDVVSNGVDHLFPFLTWPEALTELTNNLQNSSRPAYHYLYFAKIDSMGHKYGPNSPQFDAEVDIFFTTLERLLYNQAAGECGKTLFLMTADHGQVEIDPATTVYLNKELPESESWMKTTESGELMAPGGSARDLFLYIKDEHLDEAHEKISNLVEGKAEVHRVADLLEQNFFGDQPSDKLLGRLGNLCILPYANESIWWYEEGIFDQTFYGHHGGLTPQEMDTLLLALPL